MCLTIPAQVLKIEKTQALVKDQQGLKKIKTTLLPSLKKGDWILYISDLALRRIAQQEAREIIDLLSASAQQIDVSQLSQRFQGIIKAAALRPLTKKEIIYLLKTKGPEMKALWAEANLVRQAYLKDFICIHGIIEFSNYCQNDCFYCGLRKENKGLKRYRLSPDEIVALAEKAVKEKGYKLLVLQSGQDPFYTEEMLKEIVERIKARCRVFIFVSIGERDYQCYRKLKESGVSGVLLRFETSNPRLFKKLHPRGKNLQRRLRHLRFLKKLGYFIATGSLIGLPGQSEEDLADDILLTKQWAQMVSSGPFIPCQQTPLAKAKAGQVEISLKVIAVLRLLMRSVRIPVVTALETLAGEEGRKKALASGANALMFNLTPDAYRPLYQIYPNKFYQKENIWEKYGLFKYEESYQMLEQRMQKELVRQKEKANAS